MEQKIQMEFETKLNQTLLHICLSEKYEEDYQMPMLRHNRMVGILEVKGWEMEGRARYSYDVSNLVSMKSFFEKHPLQQAEIEALVHDLLETVEDLQKYMLNPECLVLQPEYIFYGKKRWYFCYFPQMKGNFQSAFHTLSEYFVKTLDYKDTEGIFLAYELHKATLEEHYDLSAIVAEFEKNRAERMEKIEEKQEQTDCGNLFSLVEESEEEVLEAWKENKKETLVQKIFGKIQAKGWGTWDDLIMETDRQGEKSAL